MSLSAEFKRHPYTSTGLLHYHSVPLIARYIALSRLCSSPQARIILATRPSEVPPGKKVKGIRLTALQSDLVRSPFTVS